MSLIRNPKFSVKLNLDERKQVLVKLGLQLQEEGLPEKVIHSAIAHNPWFTRENIKRANTEIVDAYLTKKELDEWVAHYALELTGGKKVGLLLAGNIPMVGLHDVICNFLVGHLSLVKLSDKDGILIPYLIAAMVELDERAASYFELVERLASYDAVIATGSDTSGRYFKKYFAEVPHIIRLNRNGVAVIYKDTSDASLEALGQDIFRYFGLGCRNVSKLYLEKGFDIQRIFKHIEKYRDLIHHNKYKNNYDYNHALYMMNQERYLTNDFIILRENDSVASRIAALHYAYFEDVQALSAELQNRQDQIQCIISDRPIDGIARHYEFGKAQQPGAMDYADGVDTMKFLCEL